MWEECVEECEKNRTNLEQMGILPKSSENHQRKANIEINGYFIRMRIYGKLHINTSGIKWEYKCIK